MPEEKARSLREDVLEAMADAMAQAARTRVYESLKHRETPSATECVQLIRSLANESDRAVPVILFGYLDQFLISLLQEELNPSVPGGPSGLLEGMAPLSTASARINVAQAVYWISDTVADHLRLLKSIRNEFAHNPFITFEDEQVQGWISSGEIYMDVIRRSRRLDDEDSVFTEGDVEWIPVTTVEGIEGDKIRRTSRLDFVLSCVLMLHLVVKQLYFAPTAWRLGVHPTEIMANKDEWPEEIREFDDSLGTFIDAAFWQEAVAQGRLEST